MAFIYKITSPSKRIYVGSTMQPINTRWRRYRNLTCKSQKKLYNSFIKHGVDKHMFEIITECSVDEMLKLETHWGLLYNVLDHTSGLNLVLPKDGEIFGGRSKEYTNSGQYKKGCVGNRKGSKMSDAVKEILKKANLGRKPWNKGIPMTEEAKQKMIKNKVGKPSWNKGIPFSEEVKKNMSEASKGTVPWNKGKKTGQQSHNAKLVLCQRTGIFFYSCNQAADAYNYKKTTLQAMLNGQNKNTSDLKYV